MFPPSGSGQEKAAPNPDLQVLEIIKLQAADYKDKRSTDEILQDNAFIRAAGWGKIDDVRKALKAGARINSYYMDGCIAFGDDASGSTALMWAVLGRRHDVVQLLIDNKADLNLPDIGPRHNGETALYQAVMDDDEKSIALLVKAGARGTPREIRLGLELRRAACRGFEIKEGEGYPPFPGSLGGGKGASIEELLKQGADVNSANPAGYTPLMYAANLGLVDNVKVLLANGADPTLKTRRGSTALSLLQRESSCAQEQRKQVAELLKSVLDKKKK
jgi:ankyrin repeat protein